MRIYTEKLYDTLDYIKLRTELILKTKSITALEIFLIGYMTLGKYGIYEPDLIYNEGDPDFNEFLYWIQDMPFIPVSSGPLFSNFLLNETNGNEEKAFNLFYELLDEFKKAKASKSS